MDVLSLRAKDRQIEDDRAFALKLQQEEVGIVRDDTEDEFDEYGNYINPYRKPSRERKRRRESTPRVSDAVQQDQDASYLKWQWGAVTPMSPPKIDGEFELSRLKFFLTGETEAEWLDENAQKWSKQVLRNGLSLAYKEICEILHISIEKRIIEAAEINLEVCNEGWEDRDESFALDADEFINDFDSFDRDELFTSLKEARAEIAWLKDNRDSFLQTLKDAKDRSPDEMTFYFTDRNHKLEDQSNADRKEHESREKQRLAQELREGATRLRQMAKQSEESKHGQRMNSS